MDACDKSGSGSNSWCDLPSNATRFMQVCLRNAIVARSEITRGSHYSHVTINILR